MLIRNIKETDYDAIISVLNEWWGGRNMMGMLPRLFFVYFKDTSFAVEENNTIVAFLIGFVAQSNPSHGYVHFTGVDPEYRKQGLGARLYQTFFSTIKRKGCDTVSLVTSPLNINSIAFHTRMGFQIMDGDYNVNGIAVRTSYDGPGEDRVLLMKTL